MGGRLHERHALDGRRFRTLNVVDEGNREALHFIQPGKPNQHAYIERFNRTCRRNVLDAYLFASLADVRRETEGWLTTYNTERPPDSLGQVPPLSFLLRLDTDTPQEPSLKRSA